MSETLRRVSYSQYSMWEQCPRKYKWLYLDKKALRTGSIHTIFGTGLHETIQEYILTLYTESKAKADELDLDKLLLSNMKSEFLKERTTLKEHGITDPNIICAKDDMKTFYRQGLEFITWFKKNVGKFYQKRGYQLVGIELPLEVQVREGIVAVSFLDIVLKNKKSGRILIIDLKTSKSGWGKWERGSDQKKNQLRLYKKWYSEVFGISPDLIDVEFQIMRREMPAESEFPIPRMSRFTPTHGSRSLAGADRLFNEFVDAVFNPDGTVKSDDDADFVKKPSKLCGWCPFYGVSCSGKED